MWIVSWEGSFLEFYYLSYVLIKIMSLYYNIRYNYLKEYE